MKCLRLLTILIVLASATGVYAQQKSESIAIRDELIEALENENASLRARLETEKKLTTVLTELNETRKSEAESLRAALQAKDDVLAAKDALIAANEKQIAELKKRRSSPLKRLGDILIGVAVRGLLK